MAVAVKPKSLSGRNRITKENIDLAKKIVNGAGSTPKQLEGAKAFLARAQSMLRMSRDPLSQLYPVVKDLYKKVDAKLVNALEEGSRTARFRGLTAPTTIDPAFTKAPNATDLKEKGAYFRSNDTGIAILKREGQTLIYTRPQTFTRFDPRGGLRRGPVMAARGGMIATTNAAGGRNLRAPGGKDIVGATSVHSTLDAILPKNDARRADLVKHGYNLTEPMDLMLIKVEGQKEPMVLVGAAKPKDPSGGRGVVGPWMPQPPDQEYQKGVTVICTEVQFIPFKNSDGSTGAGSGGIMTMRKPVVYLYPQTVQAVKVELAVDGQLTTTYPRIQKDNSWSVKAGPSGEIFDPATEKRFPYLFWEAKRNTPFTIDTAQAFCVANKDAEKFLEDAAQKFSFNEKERTDFVTYWLPALENNKFSLVQFLSATEYDRYATMTVSPKPDTVNRLFMIFQGVSSPVKTGNPTLPQLDRKGFTVIEWGGTNLDEQH